MSVVALINFPTVLEPQNSNPSPSNTKSKCPHQQLNPAPLLVPALLPFPPTMLKKHLSNQPTMTAKQPLTPRSLL